MRGVDIIGVIVTTIAAIGTTAGIAAAIGMMMTGATAATIITATEASTSNSGRNP